MGVSTFSVDLDRIEEGIAVILAPGGFQWHLPQSFLPADVSEGESMQITLQADPGSTSARIDRINDLRNRLEGK